MAYANEQQSAHGQSLSSSSAIHSAEPNPPPPQEQTADPHHGTDLKPTCTDFAETPVVSENMRSLVDDDGEARTATTPPLSLSRTFEDSVRPSVQKSATERPRSVAKGSHLNFNRAGSFQELPHIEREPTMDFDPYADEYDSSSSDEEDGNEQGHPTMITGTRTNSGKTSTSRPFSKLNIRNDQYYTKGKVSKRDGRLKLSISETLNSGYFSKTLGAGLKKYGFGADDDDDGSVSIHGDAAPAKIVPEKDIMEDPQRRVRLNIVMIVIGSRGDIQPFIRIGKILKDDYGHRVRFATHPAFKTFIEDECGLEFFSIGGDPSELMAFMVKNPGLIPNLETVKGGEIGRRRAAMYEMFQGMWRACINSTDDETDQVNPKMIGDRTPFICDAIIANPPSFAPPHIAERLGCPLHLMFTFPYTPTTQFPHPLANIQNSNVDAKYTNFMSYPLVEMMTWQGLGDLINRFRSKTLFLDEVSTLWAPGQLFRLKVPYTYMWSPGLVPKPKDWGDQIDLAGFVFLDLASSFKPPDDLQKFLDAGEPPVYIGFGSIVVDDPDAFTKLIFEAVKLTGVRALVSKGWGGFGSNSSTPDNIFMLENTPHDWLFPKVAAVVHHGGAGTTAIGLKCAKPTMIVPFFGDQPFWGAMVAKAKAGAHKCIPYKQLTAERMAEGIKQCLTDEAKQNVQKIADSIEKEGDGALNAVRSFHRSLPLREEGTLRCSLLPNHAAVWRLKNTTLRLSPVAAELLVEWRKIKYNDLRLLRQYEWNDFGGPGEPVTGIWGALIDTFSDIATGMGGVPYNMAKSVKKREQYYVKKYRVSKKLKQRQQKKDTLERAKKEMAESAPNNTATNNQSRPPISAREESKLSTLSVPEEPDHMLAVEFAHEAEHGLRKTAGAIIRLPLRVHLAIAQGFHNAPRLYGDTTLRRIPRITGMHSGLRAGRDEFIYGIRDGVSGLWMQPIRGAQSGGAMGCVRGVGIGLGGFVIKDLSAIVSPVPFFLKGCDEEYKKKYQPTHFIRCARICQGRKEVEALTALTPGKAASRGVSEDGGSTTSTAGTSTTGNVNGSANIAATNDRNGVVAKARRENWDRWEVQRLVSRGWKDAAPKVRAERKRSGVGKGPGARNGGI